MRLRLVSWNVNSVRLRLDGLARLVAEHSPDVLCLQEIKVAEALFPHAAIAALGYPHRAVYGQKGYHGVAILSRLPFEKPTRREWGGEAHARHLSVRLPGNIVLHNFYVPAGGDVPDAEKNPKFAHKLGFLDEVTAWFRDHRQASRQILLGDLNIAPLQTDVWSHKQLLKVVSHTPIEVEALARLADSRHWVDAVRRFVPPEVPLYSWWSYRARDWQAADRGRRLDHIWVTPKLAPALVRAEIVKAVRGWPRPSDHAPVVVDLAL